MPKAYYYILAAAVLIAAGFYGYTYIYLPYRPAQPSPSGTPAVITGSPEIQLNDQASCEKAGGIWEKGIAAGHLCNMPTTDAGKVCSDIKDCQGLCVAKLTKAQEAEVANKGFIATTGTCTAREIYLGCDYYVREGKAMAECRD